MNRILNICLLFLIPAFLVGQNNYTRHKDLPCINKEFNIAIHIVQDENGELGITEQEITDALDVLNKNVEPICASFKICSYDTIENYQYDIMSVADEYGELMIKYNKKNRINIYYVSTIAGILPEECSYPGDKRYDDPENQGFILNKSICATPEFQAMSHEMGHFFGLLSTWWGVLNGGIDELVDGSNCDVAGDMICDTPADVFPPGGLFSVWASPDCVYRYNKVDANGQPYIPDTGNTMSDFVFCRCGFSHGQLSVLANNMLEAELW
jgi:hypothetical protein